MASDWEHSLYDARKIGQKIRQARKKVALTQDKLASMAEIDRSYMGRVERGQVNLTLEKLYRLANAIGCRVHDLIL